jgi:opacity protein-like surface antigen
MEGTCRIKQVLVVGMLLIGMLGPSAWAADNDKNWTFGFRVGPAFYTQDVLDESLFGEVSSSVGPALNFQALYGISKNIAIGLAIEWQQHSISIDSPAVDLGSINTVSLLPTIEIRPGRYGKFMPYGTLAFGVNVNSFSEDDALSGVDVEMDDTFAFRIGGGADYFVTPHLALNAELAWKMNDGDFTVPGGGSGEFNASSMLVLFGIRYHM